jgi:hypothetical protein
MAQTQAVGRIDQESQRVIDYLNQARNSPFSQGNTPVSVRILAQDLSMSQEHVHGLCKKLARSGKLDEIEASGKFPFYRLA